MIIQKQLQKSFIFVLGFLVILNILAWIGVYSLNNGRFLEVNFLDVGQGDAIFIETPQKQQILIDGGPTPAVLEKIGQLMPFYDRTLDLIILSHPEKDHITGLLEILKRYEVESILWTGVVKDTAEFKEWQKLIKEEGANIKIAKKELSIVGSKNLKIEILNPAENMEDAELKDSNESSIVAKLIFGKDSFLFTGDIGKITEKKLLNQNIDSDVLKVAHHGSKYSSLEEFIKKVSPATAIIQVGKNNYGHPTSEVLDILNKFGINIFRTDKNGDVKIVSDGDNFKQITNNK